MHAVSVAASTILTHCEFQDEDDEEDDEEDEDEDDEEDDEGSDEEGEGEDYAKLPQVDTILYRDGAQHPPLPPSPLSQPPPPPMQTAFVPIQPLPEYNPADYPGGASPELQRVLVGQHMLGQQQQQQQQQPGQQLAGLAAGMLGQQPPDGLMVATPAQTLTDTLDDIMAGW